MLLHEHSLSAVILVCYLVIKLLPLNYSPKVGIPQNLVSFVGDPLKFINPLLICAYSSLLMVGQCHSNKMPAASKTDSHSKRYMLQQSLRLGKY